jgi:two-component system sensor histidine kinase and response regulator WspE
MDIDSSQTDPILDLFRAEATSALGVLRTLNIQSVENGIVAAQPVLKDLLGASRLARVNLAENMAAHLLERHQSLNDSNWTEFLSDISLATGLLDEFLRCDNSTLLEPNAQWLDRVAHFIKRDAAEAARQTISETAPQLPENLSPNLSLQPDLVVGRADSPTDVTPSTDRRIDAGLLSLFLEEAREHTANLSHGLVELEHNTANAQAIEPLMRAAHSLKGAARVVGLDYCVDVAHQSEEVLVRAQHGKLSLDQNSIDILLAASDYLAGAAESLQGNSNQWQINNEPTRLALLSSLQSILQGEPHQADFAKLTSLSATESNTAPVAARSENIAVETVATSETPPKAEPLKVNDDSGSVVRVSAKSLSRLMNLAGESLVEARWLQPFANSLQALKRRQDQATLALEDLQQQLGETHPQVLAQLQHAKRDLAECRHMLADRIGEFEEHARQSDNLNSRLYDEVIASRMRPFGDLAKGLPRLVRDTARRLNKQVHIEVQGDQTPVDRDILERLEAPLQHLLRNAIDHGLESPEERTAVGKSPIGHLRVEAHHHSGMLYLRVSDDGRGISAEKLRRKIVDKGLVSPEMAKQLSEAELLEFIFLPGFSMADKLTEVSGRGVGLDVVHHLVQSVGGAARTHTKLGEGTTFSLQLPITLSVLRAVLVTINGEPYAFPHNRTERLLRLPFGEIKSLEGRQFFVDNGNNIGLVRAQQLLELSQASADSELEKTAELAVVLVKGEEKSFGITVDAFQGELDLVVRPLDQRLGRIPNLSASAILDNGNPVLILDVEDLLRSIDQILAQGKLQRSVHLRRDSLADTRKKILVVDDSITVRELQRQLLMQRGYVVDVAVDGLDGLEMARLGRYDLIVSDIDMPRMNGLEMIRVLRTELRTESTPIIVVSYKGRDEDRQKGMQVGANYYLTKSSFQDDSYLDAVHDLIGDP